MFYSRSLSPLMLGLFISGIALSPAFVSAASQNRAVLDKMVASVNHDAITESELNEQMQLLTLRLKQSDTAPPPLSTLRKQLLERMILEKVQLQMAKDAGVEIDEAMLNQTLKDIASRDGLDVPGLEQALEAQGLPFSQFCKTIKNELTISKVQHKELGARINISESDIEHFLSSPQAQDPTGVEYRLGHILIAFEEETPSPQTIEKAETQAKGLVQELKQGADFKKTAVAKSAGQQALEGGDLGWRKTAEIPSVFSKIVPTLKVGELHGPIRDNGGFHIIKLLDKHTLGDKPDSKTFREANKAKATEVLYQRKFDEQLVPWLKRIRAEAEVAVYMDNDAP